MGPVPHSVQQVSWMIVWAEHIDGEKSGKHNKQNDMVSRIIARSQAFLGIIIRASGFWANK